MALILPSIPGLRNISGMVDVDEGVPPSDGQVLTFSESENKWKPLTLANGAISGSLRNGTGAPAPGLGNVGDFYIDTTNSLLYGPKSASGWDGGLLLGIVAVTPPPGIWSGSGSPPHATGSAGDFYIDTTNSLLYGPKTSSGWNGGLLL